MARIARSPQPTKGSHRSSRLMIQHAYGNRCAIQSVSHADWCFDMMMAGVEGTCSHPRTSQRMPQVHCAHLSVTPAQPRATAKDHLRFMSHETGMRNPKNGVITKEPSRKSA